MLSPVRLPSVVCLSSVVCNVRAPYSGGSNFRQYFYGIRYLDHPLTGTENFTEIVPGNSSAGGVKHKRDSQVCDFGPIDGYISETVQDNNNLICIAPECQRLQRRWRTESTKKN